MDTIYSTEDHQKLEQKTPWFEWVYAAVTLFILFFMLAKYTKFDFKKIFSSKKTKTSEESPLANTEKKETVSQHSSIKPTKSNYLKNNDIEVLSYSSAMSSEPKKSNHSSKQNSSSKTTHELKTAFIQAKLQQRKEERLKTNEVAQKATKEKMDSIKHEKAAKESRPSLVEPKPNKSEMEEGTLKQNKEILVPEKEKPRIREAKIKLKAHAIALLKISFNSGNNTAIKQQDMIKNLAFIYHFHRYNFARTMLQNQIIPDDGRQLRNLIVHATNKVAITAETIVQTQQQLKKFIVNEANNVTSESMQTLPLSKALKDIQDQLYQHPASPAQLSLTDYYQWMKYKIVPFMNLLNSYVNNKQADIHSINEYRAAINMLIILCGEYSAHHQIQQYYHRLEPVGSVGLHPLYEFVKQCRGIRNKLCHDIFDVPDDEIDSLLTLALKINANKEISASDTFLMPGAEVKLDAVPDVSSIESIKRLSPSHH